VWCASRADDRVVRLLKTGGVEVRGIAPPGEAKAPRFLWPRFTHDDLLDFHTLLSRDDWFDDLLVLVQRSGV
jgi:hypothetical protein